MDLQNLNRPELLEFLEGITTSRVMNYVAAGLDSLLIEGGKARLFIKSRPQETFVTPHTHKFNLLSIVLHGSVRHTRYYEALYHTPRFDAAEVIYAQCRIFPEGDFTYKLSEPSSPTKYYVEQSIYTTGGNYYLESSDYHSVEFSQDAVILLIEGNTFKSHVDILLPVDSRGKAVNTFKVEPWMFNKLK